MEKMYVVPEYIVKRVLNSNLEKPRSLENIKNIFGLIQESENYNLGFKTKLEQIDVPNYQQVNINDQCKALGMKVFDIAIPIDFSRKFIELLGETPVGKIVMCYDNSRFGNLVGITREGVILLKAYNHIIEKERTK